MITGGDPAVWIKPVDAPDSEWVLVSGGIPSGRWEARPWMDRDATRGASVDDLIDNIDAVLESYRSDI